MINTKCLQKKGFKKTLGSNIRKIRLLQEVILLHIHKPLLRLKIRKFVDSRPLKLNVGCGKVKLSSWVNIDIEPGADLIIDVRKGLPFAENSVKYIYCEHVLEHFTNEDGKFVISEFKRCLNIGGVVRIAMPDLDYIVQKYNTDWKNQEWLSWPEYKSVRSRGQMINMAFRSWDHKYLYNKEDLNALLTGAGFQKISLREWNISKYPELCNLETRKDSILIMEAEKN